MAMKRTRSSSDAQLVQETSGPKTPEAALTYTDTDERPNFVRFLPELLHLPDSSFRLLDWADLGIGASQFKEMRFGAAGENI